MFIKHNYIFNRFKFSLLLMVMLFIGISGGYAQVDGSVLVGKIVDQDGSPVKGAVVNVSEMNRIAVTDKDGNFKLKKVKPADEIYISLDGYRDTTAIVDFSGDFVIQINKETDIYKRTIAVPFGRTEKKFTLHSMSTVTGEELEKHPITVLQNAFTSTVTGVETYETSSEPGWSETALYIRGLRTTNGSARSPLIIVDDVERDLSFLDAYPIETISILKDAAATAIYGMRGANGVVLVTTKRGKEGKTKIDFTQEFGYSSPSGFPEGQNSYNYALTYNQARYLDGLDPAFSAEDIQHYKEAVDGTLDEKYKYQYFNTNWTDELLRELSPQNRTNLSISGGTKSVNYFVSFSHLLQEGMYDEKWTEMNEGYSTQHKLNRYNLRSNIDIKVNKVLDVSLDLGGRIDIINQPLYPISRLFTFGIVENKPIWPVFTPTGDWYAPSSNIVKNGPALVSSSGINYNRRRNLYTNVGATLNLDFITKGLKAKTLIGFDAYNTFQYTQSQWFDSYDYNYTANFENEEDYTNPYAYTYNQTNVASALSDPNEVDRQMYYNINTVNQLTYARTFGKHYLNVTAMTRFYKNVVTGYESSNRYLSYGGILNYRFADKYIAQITGTYQGSDNFHEDDRYGFFPAASVGWLLSEESFLDNTIVDLLKLRASIGRAGQAAIGGNRYPYQNEYSQGSGYSFGTSQSYLNGAYASTTGNREIQWEVSDMINLGMDFDLKQSRLYGSVDVFQEWRSKILVTPSSIPDAYGASIPSSSIGKVETKGFEATLGHTNHIGDFSYYIEGMITYNKNEIIDIDETTPSEPYQANAGSSIGQRNLFVKKQWASDESKIPSSAEEALASWQDADPTNDMYSYLAGTKLGNAVYIDQNGDGAITTDDRIRYGYAFLPEMIPSAKIGFAWKGFDARVLLTAYLNRTVECRENMDAGFGWGGSPTHEVTKTWGYYTDDPTDPRNINALYPRLSTTFSDVDRNYPFNQTTVWFRNGNFLSLRNIEVGYSLPKRLIAKLNMTKCRFYFSGYNLHTWSHFDSGFDPEVPTNYVWTYPKTKSFSVGVNVSF